MNKLIVIQNIEREGPGIFYEIADRLSLQISIIRFYEGDSSPLPDRGDIVLILGGPMGISELSNPNYKWLNEELKLIDYVLKNNIPFIGICLGAQLLAHMAGGTITYLTDINNIPIYEVGWSKLEFVTEIIKQEFLGSINSSFYALHWHKDRILLPDNATLLATSSVCKEQMFRIGSHAYGLQFHVEVVDDDFKVWLDEDRDFVLKAVGLKGASQLLSDHNIISKDTESIRRSFLYNLASSLLSKDSN
ncbi:type 1 glutamine amidotransferase [Prochlorococcus sp. MIT 1307]|uniref:type 1 glutamine amidotransferase n=1 Tax=Prochlorococcus sp. MIT 1307 TaxID=3096219 RepID=UPI002A75EDA5|nr:type 1 glutamine amidotransferase [Prochlorococcus sp. MIT 1307]